MRSPGQIENITKVGHLVRIAAVIVVIVTGQGQEVIMKTGRDMGHLNQTVKKRCHLPVEIYSHNNRR